ncbi:MAG: hypothetical protein ABIM21_04095 [candidate division WOR-3 bacterium]
MVEIKGISLPINTAVIVIVALIVLVSIIAYLYLFPPQTGCGSLVELGCLKLKGKGCDIDGDGVLDQDDIDTFPDLIWGCRLDQIRHDAGYSAEEFFRHCGCIK